MIVQRKMQNVIFAQKLSYNLLASNPRNDICKIFDWDLVCGFHFSIKNHYNLDFTNQSYHGTNERVQTTEHPTEYKQAYARTFMLK